MVQWATNVGQGDGECSRKVVEFDLFFLFGKHMSIESLYSNAFEYV